MTSPTGSELRRRREEIGLPLDALAEAIGIPIEYLVALEEEQTERMPPGYGQRYASAVDRYLTRQGQLGIARPLRPNDPDTFAQSTGPIPTPEGHDSGPAPLADVRTRPVPEAEEDGGLPLVVVRTLAIAMLALVVVLFVQQVQVEWSSHPGEVPEEGPDPMVIKVKLNRNARLRVEVDGVEREHRVFAGAEEVTYVALREVAVDVPDISAVQVWLDERRVRPRGRTGRARTLRFVAEDDGGGGWTSAH